MDIKLFFLDGILIGLFLLVACLMVVMYLNIFYFIFLKVPTLSTGNKAVEKILESINLKGKKKFYDLGSGNGRVVSCLAEKYPELECVGIEYNITAHCHAKIRNLFSKNKVSYWRKNFFKIDLGDADVIYVYLYPPVMERLEAKFAKELRKGTLVVMNSFPLKTKEPKMILRGKSGALNTLYIYEY
jgi:hypothetical protein